MTSGIAITLFVVGVVASIMVHEWGHFWTARRFGMRVDRFFLGFGPTLWSTRRGETEYGVKLLPLGGFVRIKGMSPLDERLRPVPDVVLDPEMLAADRRTVADQTHGDLLTVAAITDAAFDRLDRELDARGAPAALRQRLVHRFRTNLAPDATPAEARRLLVELITSETTETDRVGDLRHRLLAGDEGRFFPDRPAWQRSIVLAAGSTLHMIQAAALLFLGFLLFGQQAVTPTVGEFTPDSAAEAAGLQPGDRITAIGQRSISDFEEIRDVVQRSPGEPLELMVQRDGERLAYTVTPEPTQDPETGETIGLIGVRPGIENRALPADEALYETFIGDGSVTRMTVETVKALGRVFGPEGIGALFSAISGETERSQDGGISLVGAAGAAGSGTAAFGPLFLFFLLASVNVFVGIFNILPLPPLDGGHLAVLGIERTVNGVRSARGQRPDFSIDPRAVAAVALPVIVLVGVVSLGFLWLDITDPIQIGP